MITRTIVIRVTVDDDARAEVASEIERAARDLAYSNASDRTFAIGVRTRIALDAIALALRCGGSDS